MTLPGGPAPTSPPPQPAPQAPARRLPDIEPGSVTAQVLAHAWVGDPATVVASPPGAGKSTLVAGVASHLAGRARLRVAVATQTNNQAVDLANRIATATDACPVLLLTRASGARPAGLDDRVDHASSPRDLGSNAASIVISTAARWLYIHPDSFPADVAIVDEAWQMTWATFGAFAPISNQFVLVGDPGQIDPVVVGSTSRWASQKIGPHRPAPDMLTEVRDHDVRRLRLPYTYRLGPDTAALIQPVFYPDLPFTSARPARTYTAPGNTNTSPEITASQVRSLGGQADPAVADEVAAAVRHLLGGTVTTDTGDQIPVTPDRIGVVCAHNSQVAAVKARLGNLAVDVSTTETWQGLEREVIVVWHPLAGQRDLTEFHKDTGRLCVMLSRHRAHCHVVYRADTGPMLDTNPPADPSDREAWNIHRQIIDHLDTIRS
jgi:hypothetical protein